MMPECTFAVQSTIDYYFNQGNLVTWSMFAVQSTIDYYFNQGNLVTWSMHTVSALNTDTSDS
jgi:hypothetical protein